MEYLLLHIGADPVRSEYVSVASEVSNEEENTQRVSVFRAFDPRQIEAIGGRWWEDSCQVNPLPLSPFT